MLVLLTPLTGHPAVLLIGLILAGLVALKILINGNAEGLRLTSQTWVGRVGQAGRVGR